MMLEDTLRNLKEIGIDEIHTRTHISIHSLNAIINTNFAGISSIQFNGFINLIERNFNVNLDALRAAHESYRQEHGQDVDERELFVQTPIEIKSKLSLYLGLGVVLFLGLIFFIVTSDSTEINYSKPLENEAIEDAKKHISFIEQNSSTTSANETTNVATFNPVEAQTEEAKAKHLFVLYPKDELWIGVVNIDNDEQVDTITSEPYVLDENANLLISLGHGYVKVELYDKVQDLTDQGRVRFHYKNGELNRISASKFRELNKGKSW